MPRNQESGIHAVPHAVEGTLDEIDLVKLPAPHNAIGSSNIPNPDLIHVPGSAVPGGLSGTQGTQTSASSGVHPLVTENRLPTNIPDDAKRNPSSDSTLSRGGNLSQNEKDSTVNGEHSLQLKDLESQKSIQDGEMCSSSSKFSFSRIREWFSNNRWVFTLFFGLLFTAWWISIIAQDEHRHEWLIPTVLWILLMIRFITFYVPTRPILMAAKWVWDRTFIPVRNRIPERLWIPIEAVCLLITILVSTFATPETPDSLLKDRAVSFFGYFVFFFVFYVFSQHRRRIRWHTVIWGLFLQFVIALFVLRTKAGFDIFTWISFLARKLLSFSSHGTAFLTSQGFVKQSWFIVTTLCSVLFFIAFIHIWFYFGVIQWFLGKFSQGFYWLMQISGAEAVVVAATPFFGVGESAVLIKPILPYVTEAEMFQIMTSGFATVSGSVLASYVHMGVNPAALITSCVMSIPGSIAAAKLVVPETEESITSDHAVAPENATEEAYNVVHAFSNGSMMGLQIALSMGATILCIIALVALIDALLTYFGKFWGIPALSLEQIMGYIFYPVSFLLGVSRNEDLYKVAKLLGIKIVQNEFVAYNALFHDPEYSQLSERSKLVATYALCGFSNVGTCGIQLAVLSSIAPTRKSTVAKLLIFSLFVGCFSTFTSAAVAGMLMKNLSHLNGSYKV